MVSVTEKMAKRVAENLKNIGVDTTVERVAESAGFRMLWFLRQRDKADELFY